MAKNKSTIFLAADHGGRKLMVTLEKALKRKFRIVTLTPQPQAGDDYPLAAALLSRTIQSRPRSFGIALCRTGAGMAIVTNKFPGIRAIQGLTPALAKRGRRDEDANVLALAADSLTSKQAVALCTAFVSTQFRPVARYVRRLGEIARYEHDVSA